MTLSIIARDEQTGRVGIAIAGKSFAVGARNAFLRTGVGAIGSQGFFNPFYGPRGLALLAAGASAEDTIRLLTTADDGRENRQLHVMDRRGQFAAFTGAHCGEWCGHLLRATFSLAGGVLAGPQVLDAMAAAYEAEMATAFARRLIAALKAGERAGGNKNGRQSASLLIHDDEDYSLLDLRIDDHPDPLAELERLEAIARQSWVHVRRLLPSRSNPNGLLDHAEVEACVARSIAEGYE
jgi:uncharacterized Ntn-hydrolase superfamily protein